MRVIYFNSKTQPELSNTTNMKNRLNKLHHGLYEKLARQIKTYDTSNIALIHDHLVCILKRKNTAPFKGFAIDSLR